MLKYFIGAFIAVTMTIGGFAVGYSTADSRPFNISVMNKTGLPDVMLGYCISSLKFRVDRP